MSKENTEQKELLTVKETAKLLRVSVSSIYRWTKEGYLTKHGIGHRVFYKRTEVIEALIPLEV